MKHLLLISLFLCNFCDIAAMYMHKQCLLPSAETLRARLLTIPECQHFVENSQIITMFADQAKFPVVVFMAIGSELDIYAQRFKNKVDNINTSVFSIATMKPKMVELILEDHPFALVMLKKKGVLTDSM